MHFNTSIKEKRIFGRIFLPDYPQKKAEAWLTISEKTILLESTLTAVRNEFLPIILGEFNGMDRVTFLNCHASGGVSVGTATHSRFRASGVISGKHISQPSELLFKEVRLLSPALEAWIFKPEFIEDLDDGMYRIPKPDEIVNLWIDKINLTIVVAYATQDSGFELQVKRVCWITLRTEEPADLDSYIQCWRHLKKLILFLTHKNPEFDKIVLDDGEDSYSLINIKDEIQDSRFWQHMNVTYNLIGHQLKDVITRWFTDKKLYAVIDLVIEKLINVDMSTQAFFLNVCVAIETFHANYGIQQSESIDNRSQKREQIAGLIQDPDLKDWFMQQSHQWKRPSLRDRLMSFRETMLKIKGNTFKGMDIDQLIGNIVKTRNDMAHTGEFGKRFNYVELMLAAKITELTVRIEMFKLLGIDITTHSERNSLLSEATGAISSLARLNKYE